MKTRESGTLNFSTQILSLLLSFAENEIRFQCNYDRSINVDQSYQVVGDFQPQPVQGQGELSYNMEVISGELGGTTQVRVIPNHGLNQIAPK